MSNVSDFAELARGFCAWCEGESFGEHPERDAAVWLARLHAGALLLPDATPTDDEEAPALADAPLGRAHENLGRFMGAYYRTHLDPDPSSDATSTMGDLGDDLLDVYIDIKRGLVLFEHVLADHAVAHWTEMHRSHWGAHTVGALSALYGMSRVTR